MANVVVVGPWGGPGGSYSFFYEPDGRIVEINISSEDDIVNSISFSYVDRNNIKHTSEVYGGNGGSLHTISLSGDEVITGISGTFGMYAGMKLITSLSFQSNDQTYGPYGKVDGEGFTLPVTTGKIVGYHGYYGDYLDSFAVILRP